MAANITNGIVTVRTGAGSDQVAIAYVNNGATMRVTENGANRDFPAANVRQVKVWLGAGNDVLNAGAVRVPMWVGGEGGDDVINTGIANDDVVGGAGNDRINTGRGNDALRGNDGNDTLTGGAGNDLYVGGAGNDIFNMKDGNPYDRLQDRQAGDTVNRDSIAAGSVTKYYHLNDRTGEVWFRGNTVRFQKITYPGVDGTFYKAWINNQLVGEHRANGKIHVMVPNKWNFQIDATLRQELTAAKLLFIEELG